jgi:hypothetical protein
MLSPLLETFWDIKYYFMHIWNQYHNECVILTAIFYILYINDKYIYGQNIVPIKYKISERNNDVMTM